MKATSSPTTSATTTGSSWSPCSWRQQPVIAQIPACYLASGIKSARREVRNESSDSKDPISQTLSCIATEQPGLVSVDAVQTLKKTLAEAQTGRGFLLHIGDCAESFDDCNEDVVKKKVDFFAAAASKLEAGFREKTGDAKPVLQIGRIAGQYAKPRSAEQESVDGKMINSYKGEIMNGFSNARDFDASRLQQAYDCASKTINFIQRRTAANASSNSEEGKRSDDELSTASLATATSAHDLSSMLETSDGSSSSKSRGAPLYTSHEGLLLPFEEALVRTDPDTGATFASSAHMLWIGERTRQLNGAHVEFLRGVSNPIGLKVGPKDFSVENIVNVSRKLNPRNEQGKLVIITRFGASEVENYLPQLVEGLLAAKVSCLFEVDPMHGNTKTVSGGGNKIKTRYFDDVVQEVLASYEIHKRCGSTMHGIHLEATFDADVTECIGPVGAGLGVPEQPIDLTAKYTSYCDPRLNRVQTMELIDRFLERL